VELRRYAPKDVIVRRIVTVPQEEQHTAEQYYRGGGERADAQKQSDAGIEFAVIFGGNEGVMCHQSFPVMPL
jgi:hypothetical protein